MRVRPFFWVVLLVACGGVLVFAATHCSCGPAILQVQVAQNPGPTAITVIKLHATDPDGLPLDGVQLLPNAKMTNMNMTTRQIYTTPQGQGNYLLRLRLYMVGPWAVTISMQAQGFAPLNRTIFVQVQPTAPGYPQGDTPTMDERAGEATPSMVGVSPCGYPGAIMNEGAEG